MSKARMIEAVKQLDFDAVRDLLAIEPDLLSATDRRGFNLLHLSCCVPCADLGIAESQSAKVVNLLGVEKEFDPAQLAWLVDHGASPDLKDRSGVSARERASRKRDKRWLGALE